MPSREYVFIDRVILQHPIDVEIESEIKLINFVEPIDIPTQPIIEVL